MGLMQENLKSILKTLNFEMTDNNLQYPNHYVIYDPSFKKEVDTMYKRLGGIKDHFPANLGKWDIEFNGIAVELDEYLHFNRYRKITLSSSLYDNLPSFPIDKYRNYCELYESECLKAGSYGGKWTNKSCESQFGKASQKGILRGNGSPRWKQRAFYDFIKDLSPLIIKVPVVRISIWDEISINGKRRGLEPILQLCDFGAASEIHKLIQERNPKLNS